MNSALLFDIQIDVTLAIFWEKLQNHPLRNKDPLKTWKLCSFFGRSFFKIKIADFLNFHWIKYLGKGLLYLKNWGIGATIVEITSRRSYVDHLDQRNNKHTKIAVNSAIQYCKGRCQSKCLLKVWSFWSIHHNMAAL